jgi:hypothetical protein
VKDERGFGLYRIMSRLLPILTLTSWRWSWMATLMTKDNTFATGTDTVGYQRFEARIFRVLPGQEIRKREYYLATAERQDVQRTIFRPETAELNIPLGWPTEHDIAEAHRAVWGEEHSDLYS